MFRVRETQLPCKKLPTQALAEPCFGLKCAQCVPISLLVQQPEYWHGARKQSFPALCEATQLGAYLKYQIFADELVYENRFRFFFRKVLALQRAKC